MTTALIVVDVQRGFDDPYWGTRNNPAAETNIRSLVQGWQQAGQPTVLVRHDSTNPRSPLAAGNPGNDFKPEVADVEAALLVTKNVHSAFHGHVDLDGWLTGRGITDLVICGIQTNRCVETTSRVGGDLGYRVRLAIDATFTFTEVGPDGGTITADQFTASTAANLHNNFGQVTTTAAVLDALPVNI